MAYREIKSYDMSEQELRQIWHDEYCTDVVYTFDKILVKFYEEMFDHAFYESANRKEKDKSILSHNRLEKIYWIKEALQDPEAILKHGWDTKRKEYFTNRRIAIVKGNYVVIIRFTGKSSAKFITAYEKDDISNIMNSPDYKVSN